MVKRKGNRPAHLLAKYAEGIDDFIIWMEENPCFLEQALSHDVLSWVLWIKFSVSYQKKKKISMMYERIYIYIYIYETFKSILKKKVKSKNLLKKKLFKEE